MLEQYGQQIMSKPKGMLRAVHLPSMATMDKRTGDGRRLMRDGRGVRELPRTLFFQTEQQPGHEGSVPVGRIDAIQFHDDGNVEGWGWILDNDAGVDAALHIQTKTQFHNSVDLAEVKVKLDIAEDDAGELELLIDFTEWKIAASTIVGKPAFADASAEMLEELTASLRADDTPLEWEIGSFEFRTDALERELTASLATDETVVPWADFHIPEAETYQKIVVDAERRVFGHLGIWDLPDDVNPNIRVPRPPDGYASFNQSGPLTELGHVETGPLFWQHGHPSKPLGGRDPYEAYGGVENCWADVRVTAGKFGPWISGRVRPGVSDEVVYAARASRISGHWVGDKLRAIVSVNVPRFNVPGSGKLANDSFYEATFAEDGSMLELVASFPSFLEEVVIEPEDDELEELDEYIAASQVGELAVDTTPTTEMSAEAEQGLAWRKQFKRGGGTVALARARDIKNRKKLSNATLRRMSSFFKRHEGDKADPGWSRGDDAYPSAARINWALWGGDAAQGWVSSKLTEIEQDHTAAEQAAIDADVLLLELELADD